MESRSPLDSQRFDLKAELAKSEKKMEFKGVNLSLSENHVRSTASRDHLESDLV
jgi:hypothetical protein